MFETLTPPKLDSIIAVIQAYAADPRPGKIDLGVGVYRDEAGRTPIMAAVKAAEARILATQESKTYQPLSGDPAYLQAMEGLLLGGAVPSARVAAVGTPGGTAAVRQVLELVRSARPEAVVWVSAQTWPNHWPLIAAAGLAARPYRYLDPESGTLDRAGLLADLGTVAHGDLVLLHGCCHNPSGVDLDVSDWADLAALLDQRGAVPFIDMAYQGFGTGLDADAAGLRHLAARLPEVLVAASCSKNFSLYCDRAGIALAIVTEGQRDTVAATLSALNRQNYAFPPDHAGRVVSTILGDTVLRMDWLTELDAMRERVTANRRSLAQALQAETGSDRFAGIGVAQGMFSLLPLAAEEIAALRADHAVYVMGDGRANMAGLSAATIDLVARAVGQVLR
ncbi:MAG: amino acid aminotransferase [Roseinatronobacter sp.]